MRIKFKIKMVIVLAKTNRITIMNSHGLVINHNQDMKKWESQDKQD